MKKKEYSCLHLITSNNCLPNKYFVKICDFYTEPQAKKLIVR